MRKWYGEVPDPKGGKPKRVPLSTDKQAARAMLRDLERQVERRKAGIIDEHAEGRSMKEIGTELGLNFATVYQVLRRAGLIRKKRS